VYRKRLKVTVDLLNCALGEIDYHELAEHFVEEDA
jgi:hypothetical protein